MKMKYFLPLLLLIIFSVSTVSADISWTGSNWVFGYNKSLIQYNGTTFTDITPNTAVTPVATLIKNRKYISFPYLGASPWSNVFWLKDYLFSISNNGVIGVYYPKNRIFYIQSRLGSIYSVACNDNYCLINDKPDLQMVHPILLKYNGDDTNYSNFTLTDITNQLGAYAIRGTIRAKNISEMNISEIYGDISGVNLSAVSDAIHRWIWTNGSKSSNKENITDRKSVV